MNRKDSSLFIAYLAFLLICIVFRVLCLWIPSLSNELWDRIIIGVTISSYCFTISSGLSMSSYNKLLFHQKLDESASQIVFYADKYLDEHEDDSILTEDEIEFKDILKDIKQHQIETVLKEEIGTKTNKSSYLDVIGFLVFLLCLTFQPISDFFLKEQDLYTLLAFFLMLFIVYNKERFEQRIERSSQESRIMVYRIKALCEKHDRIRAENSLKTEATKNG